ncbi:MAG: amidohydrolase family protein, partial [Acidobacteria bacterium]|nr:amidohydrolase family protein [Acidobacteriota bacterium]
GRAPERYVGHGVLHVRDMGGRLDELLPLRDDIRSGRRVGPNLVIAGPTLNSEQPADFHRKVTTDAEARAAVRELKARGVDFLKVHRATNREAFNAIVDEAGKAGLTVSGHVPLVMSWAEASRAGLRTIEHIQTVFENLQPDLRLTPARFTELADALDGALGDEFFGVLKAQGTYFDPTLVGYEATFENASPEAAAARRQAYARMKPIAAKAARLGVPIITGTDVLDRHGDLLLMELERLVEIGMTPRDVLTSATVTSAAAAGRADDGRLQVGGPASFLLVDGNPLDDIRALRRLSTVVLRGQVLDAATLATLRP